MSVTAVFVSTVHVVSSVYHMRVRVRVNFTLFARDHMNCCEKSASLLGIEAHFPDQSDSRIEESCSLIGVSSFEIYSSHGDIGTCA